MWHDWYLLCRFGPASSLFRIFFCSAFLALFFLLAPRLSQALTILTEEDPPLNFSRNGQVTGLSAEIVQEMMRRMNVTAPIQVLPWARAYHLAQSQPEVLLFSLVRTPERENRFAWIGPLLTDDWIFFARRGSNLKLSSLDEARKLESIGVYRQDVRHEFLARQGFANLDLAVDSITNLRKLFAGRIQAVLMDEVGTPRHLAVLNRTMGDLEPLLTVKSVELYAGFSNGTDPGLVARWRRTFEKLRREGFLARMKEAWLGRQP